MHRLLGKEAGNVHFKPGRRGDEYLGEKWVIKPVFC